MKPVQKKIIVHEIDNISGSISICFIDFSFLFKADNISFTVGCSQGVHEECYRMHPLWCPIYDKLIICIFFLTYNIYTIMLPFLPT